MRIAVDFDETLIRFTDSGHAEAVPGAIEAMETLRAEGHTLIVYSCRTGIALEAGRLAAEIKAMTNCLRDCGIPFDEIWTGTKLVADIYVDDRSVTFRGNWRETCEEIATYRAGRD